MREEHSYSSNFLIASITVGQGRCGKMLYTQEGIWKLLCELFIALKIKEELVN